MAPGSYDSGQRPLADVQYQQAPGSADEYAPPPKKGISNWIKFGVPVLILVIVGAVVGGVVGSRAKNNDRNTSNNGGGGSAGPSNPSDVASIKGSVGRFATGTDSYLLPVYPSTTNTAAFTSPTFVESNNPAIEWPADPFTPANPSMTEVRTDRPRLIAPNFKWSALPALIETDPYLKGWHERIMGNASAYNDLPPVAYFMDGGSGILDIARETKMRVKAFAYAYRMTNQTSWVDRLWRELQNAAGNGTQPFGEAPDRWNTAHFLDTAEFTGAYAIAYDWLYEVWTPEQREQIMWTMLNLGLNYGLQAHTGTVAYNWWRTVNGNWNCVCNGGLTLGGLAIMGDDPTGTAAAVVTASVENAREHCVMSPSTDGSWSEGPNYWYFGTSAHAEMTAALQSATGSDHGMLTANPSFRLTSLYHIYVTGMTSMFDYSDHGPNKFSTTANGVLHYGVQYNEPLYTLYQRDRFDAAEPYSMFYYDPSVTGAWWDQLPLDHYFDAAISQWASMRSSWTDNNGVFVAIKAGLLSDHQSHGDLDIGDFVIDALGTRWAGDLGSGDYLAPDYFTSEAQDAVRWTYYRKMTEGQNTISIGGANQLVTATPTVRYESSGTVQGSSTVLEVPDDSTAYFVTDMSSAYGSGTLHRGIRLLNGRRQILLQDEITAATGVVRWRMHTNATITIGSGGTTADLAIGDKRLQVQLLNAPTGAQFASVEPVRTADAPALATGNTDQPNPGVSVLQIELPAGTHNLQVLFTPQIDGVTPVTPPAVALDSWTLTSHN